MTNTKRQAEFVKRQKAMNRSGRKYWATSAEHENLKDRLKEIRKQETDGTIED
jgi:hypothetical protein